MPSTVIEITNWARPHVGRKIHRVQGRRRIDTQLRAQGLIVGRGRSMRRVKPFVVTTNGKDFLLAADWKRCLKDDEVLLVVAAPPAGGGGSKILAILAIVALSIFTAGIAAGLLATAGGLFAAGSVSAAVLAAGVSIAGTALINALTPQPKPPAGQDRGTTSPNYSISAQGNTARLMEAIPVLYGRFRIYPDYAAQPYTDYRSNDQYLYQLFVVTQGKVSLEAVRIDETAASSYTDVQYEVIQPGGQVTLFPDNVVTSDAVSGLQLEKPSDGGDWAGPFITNPPETTTTRIGIDMGWPGGLYRYNDSGKKRTANSRWTAQAQRIDDEGTVIGDWFTLISESKSSDSEKPLYTSYNFDVPEGRYQVRLREDEPDDLDGQIVNTIMWQSLKSFLPSKATYGDCTMIAMVIKGGAQVNGQTSRKVNVIGTRILPVWDGASWTEQATRSPAWALADAFRNTTYGRGWTDSRINLEGLLSHAQTWATRGDFYDGVFDTKMALWDAVTQIARAGRAVPMYFAGVVEVIRDTARAVPTLMLTPDLIVQGSFKIDYSYPTYDSPDYVVVEYTNPNTWQPQTVDCALVGSKLLQPKNVQLPGVISRDQAFREGMYMAASNRDQRKFVTVTVEMEGYIPRYGDRIDVSHDVPAWGLTGRIEAYDEDTGVLSTSEPLAWYAGQNHYVALRAPDGSAQGPYLVLQGADLHHMVLSGLTDQQKAALSISDGSEAEPTVYAFGPGSQQSQSCLLLRATPQGDDHVELYMVNYAPSVYLAEVDASTPPPGSPSLLTPASGAPDVGDIGLNQNAGSETVHLWVAPVAGATSYEFQISYDGGVTWMPVGVSLYNYIDAVIPPGTWIVRARAFGEGGLAGGWNQNPVTVDGKPWPLGALQSLLTFELVMGIKLVWALPTGFGVLDASATEIRLGATDNFALSSFLAQISYPTATYTHNDNSAGQTYYFWARLVSKSGGDPGPWIGPVAGSTSSDATAILAVLDGQITESLLGQSLLGKIADIDVNSETIIKQSLALGSTNDDARASRAYIARLDETKATPDQAQAIAQQTLGAQLGDLQAAAQETTEVYVDSAGNAHAFNVTKVGVTKNGVTTSAGLAIGVETVNGQPLAQVLIEAERFAVVNNVGNSLVAAFAVVGDQTFINEAFIAAASITTAKIADAAITNAKIAGVIQSNDFLTGVSGWKIDKNGTPEFNNGVFRGDLTARSITGNFQASATVEWTGNVSSNPGGAIMSFVCPAPVRDGQAHRPEISCEVMVSRQGGDDASGATLYLERQDPNSGAWIALANRTYGLGKYQTIANAFVYLDANLSSASTYRFRFATSTGDTLYITGIHGRVIGQRTA